MLNNLLNSVIQDGALTLLLGLIVTFGGIAIIVIFVSLAGKIFNLSNGEKKPKVKEVKVEKVIETALVKNDDEVPEHVKAAIIAAIMAYYDKNEPKSKCDFIVRRIRRI